MMVNKERQILYLKTVPGVPSLGKSAQMEREAANHIHS